MPTASLAARAADRNLRAQTRTPTPPASVPMPKAAMQTDPATMTHSFMTALRRNASSDNPIPTREPASFLFPGQHQDGIPGPREVLGEPGVPARAQRQDQL